jgi:hypothetical protein
MEQTNAPSRSRARLAVAWNAASLVLPSVLAALTNDRWSGREIIAVELAGSGQRLLDLAEGQPESLERFRRVLGLNDNYYVGWYGTGLLLGISLLPRRGALAGAALVAAALAADVVENQAIEEAVGKLLRQPQQPDLADAAAQRARLAAAAKFALLVPSAALVMVGVARGLRG